MILLGGNVSPSFRQQLALPSLARLFYSAGRNVRAI
jgi:hypothetical protein